MADLVVGTIICPGVPDHEHKIYRSELFPEYQGTTASIQGLVDERNDYRKGQSAERAKWEKLKNEVDLASNVQARDETEAWIADFFKVVVKRMTELEAETLKGEVQ